MKKSFLIFSFIIVAAIVTSVYLLGMHHGHTGKGLVIAKEAMAAQEKPSVSPVNARGNRGTYYPNTEDLAPDEMRMLIPG